MMAVEALDLLLLVEMKTRATLQLLSEARDAGEEKGRKERKIREEETGVQDWIGSMLALSEERIRESGGESGNQRGGDLLLSHRKERTRLVKEQRT